MPVMGIRFKPAVSANFGADNLACTFIVPELFSSADLPAVPSAEPRTVPEAIAAGHSRPDAANPFLWSSILWEAFNIGQYLRKRRISPDGFRKVHGKYEAPIWNRRPSGGTHDLPASSANASRHTETLLTMPEY
jgi:hypothetical protein